MMKLSLVLLFAAAGCVLAGRTVPDADLSREGRIALAKCVNPDPVACSIWKPTVAFCAYTGYRVSLSVKDGKATLKASTKTRPCDGSGEECYEALPDVYCGVTAAGLIACPAGALDVYPTSPDVRSALTAVASSFCAGDDVYTPPPPPPAPIDPPTKPVTPPPPPPAGGCASKNEGTGNKGCGNVGNDNVGSYNIGSNNYGDNNVGSNNKGSCNIGSNNAGNGWVGSNLGPGNGPNWPACKRDR